MSRRQQRLRQEHEYVFDRLSSYMDGQLDAQERDRVETHLHTCPSCREELRTLEWTRELLHQVPTVPLPRSFVIREADLVPQREIRQPPMAARSRFGVLRWATALVAIFLVLVIAGDIFLGTRSAAPGSQPEIAMLSKETSTTVATTLVESEKAAEAPQAEKATEEEAPLEPTTEAPRMLVAPTPVAETRDAGETTAPAEVMGGGEPPTGTTTRLPMRVEETPVKAMPVETVAEKREEGNVLSDGTPPSSPDIPPLEQQVPQEEATVPDTEQQRQGISAETPIAMAPPSGIRAGAPSPEPKTAETPEQEISPDLPALLTRAGWRVAEVGLGILLLGLIIFMIWGRQRS